MIIGAHFLLYSTDPEADQQVLQEVLGRVAVDAGGGRLILGLPPAELATHEAPHGFSMHHAEHELLGLVAYLVCDDLHSTVRDLAAKAVECTEIEEAEWGWKTTIRLPSGGEIGLYQPSHPTAFER